MSLDDLINSLLDEKAPATPAKSPAAAAGAPNGAGSEEAAALKGEVQRLTLEVKALRTENEALRSAPQPAAQAAPAAAAPDSTSFVGGGTAKAGAGAAFPWKRHISAVEDSIRKKQTEIAECALKVLVDVAEVIDVEAPARARLLTQLGQIRLEQGQQAEAEASFKQALALLDAAGQAKSVAAAFALDSLAEIHFQRDDYVGAENTRREAVTIAEDMLGAEHPDCGYFRERLEELRQNRSLAQIGADDRSKTLLTKLTEEYNAAMADGTYQQPTEKPLDSYSGLMLDKFVANAKTSINQKNMREAESYLRSAMEKADGVPNNDPRKCEATRMLADVLEKQGKDNEAREHYEKALTIAFKHIGWQDIQVAHCLHSLADLHNRVADFGLAKNYYKQAITAFQAISGREHETTKLVEDKYKEFVERVKAERQWKNWSN